MYMLTKSIRNEAQLSCLSLYSVVLWTWRVCCTQLYIILKLYKVSTYATAIHYTQRQITTRTTLHYNIIMSVFTQFRVHIGIHGTQICQKYTCSEWAWLYASGYPLKCIAPLFPIGTRNIHSSPQISL